MSRPSSAALPLVVILFLAACQASGPSSSTPSVVPSAASPEATPEPSAGAYHGADAVVSMAAGPRGVAWAAGSVWVASTLGDVIQRVDPTTSEVVAMVAAVRPVTLVTVGDELWASVLNADPSADDELVRIDPTTNAINLRATVPVHHNIAVGGGAIWVQDVTGTLRRLDPAGGEVTEVATVGIGPVALAATDEAVYGIRGGGQVWRLPLGGAAIVEADLGVDVPGRSRVAATTAGVIVAVPGQVLALDPDGLAIQAQLSLPGMSLVNDLWVTDTDAWLSANVVSDELGLDGGSVLRLDPATLEIREVYQLGPESSGVVVAAGSVWAVDQSDDVLLRFPLSGG